MSDTEQEESHGQSANKPRPISFGAVLSKTSDLIAGAVSPRRSLSTRISNYSNRDNLEQPSRDSSTSPLSRLRPATSQGLSVRSTSPLHLSFHMDPGSQDDRHHNNINKRFSKFSFVKSYANSATDASDAQEEPPDEDSEDGQEISRFGSVSTSSEYPPGTSQKVKSPPPGNKLKSGPAGEETDSSRGYPFPSGGTTSSLQGFLDDINIEDGIMLAGESERGSKFSLPIGKKMSRSGEAGSVRNDSASQDRMVPEVPPIQVQAPITPTVSHVTQEPKSPRAEKTLHVPFLHKFKPRSKSSKRPSISGPIAVQHNQPHGQQTVASFFDAASSDGEDDNDDVKPEPISKDSFQRSVVVSQNNSPPVGLTDILKRGPSDRSENISPLSPLGTQRKLHSNAIRNVDDATRENRRSGVVGWPASEHDVDGPQTAGVDTVGTKYARGDDRVSGLWDDETNGPPGSAPPLGAKHPPNGLRSHPTSVRGPPPKRVVTFPTNITERRDSLWDREPSTPHPFGRKANLTVVVYSRGGSHHRVPALEKILIPLVAHEGHSPLTAVNNVSSEKRASSTRRSFDDEALFLLLRASYRRLRGTFLAKCSARRVCSVRLLGFENQCQLVTDRATHQCFSPSNNDNSDKNKHTGSNSSKSDEEVGFAEARLLELYRCPRMGRSRWEWWDWVRGLPENIAAENGGGGEAALLAAAGRSNERFALELVEGWSVGRIVVALGLVGVCSIAACLLWIFLGVNHVDAGAVGAGSPSSLAATAAAAASTMTGGVEVSSGRDGVAITSAATGLVSPASLAAEVLSASARLPRPTSAPALGTEVSNSDIMNDEASATVEQRDINLTSMMSSMASQTPEQTQSPTSHSAASDVPVGTKSGDAGSRVGAGVAMGVLVLLVGWMLVGAWLAMSWLL